MVLGMSVDTFTLVHTILSLVGILAGCIALYGMITSHHMPGWTALFLATTILTSVTGFFFPRDQVLPSHIVGVLSLLLLAAAVIALYARHLAGAWRWIYLTGAVGALYLNVFVGVVQAFQKIPALHALAPTQAEWPFILVQGLVLALFAALFVWTLRAFHPRGHSMPTAAA
jgi:hypothetical protein